MLAQLTDKHYPNYGQGRVAVLTAKDDTHAKWAVKDLAAMLHSPDQRLHHLTLEELVTVAEKEPDLVSWTPLFVARYILALPGQRRLRRKLRLVDFIEIFAGDLHRHALAHAGGKSILLDPRLDASA